MGRTHSLCSPSSFSTPLTREIRATWQQYSTSTPTRPNGAFSYMAIGQMWVSYVSNSCNVLARGNHGVKSSFCQSWQVLLLSFSVFCSNGLTPSFISTVLGFVLLLLLNSSHHYRLQRCTQENLTRSNACFQNATCPSPTSRRKCIVSESVSIC